MHLVSSAGYYIHMEIEEKEQKLHKIVAASGFLFVLLMLPLVQYLITSGQKAYIAENNAKSSQESGQVAGASTDENVLAGATTTTPGATDNTVKKYASVQDCQAQKAKDSDDLDKFANGKKIALKNTYEESVAPYKKGLDQLNKKSKNYVSERGALDQLISDQYATYLRKLDEVEKAVSSQKASIDSVECSVE